MLLVTALLIVVFLVSLWFTGFIAKALGARRPGLVWVFLVFLAIVVIQVVMGLTPLAQHPLLALLVLVVVASLVYAKILDMKLLNGFVTMLVSSIVSGILAVAVVLIAGISFPGLQGLMSQATPIEGEVTLETAAIAAEAVCQCETDRKCLADKSRYFGRVMGAIAARELSAEDEKSLQRYTQRGFECTLKPGRYDVSKAVVRVKPKYQAKPVVESADMDDEPVAQPSADEMLSAIVEKPAIPVNVLARDEDTKAQKESAEEENMSQPSYQAVLLKDAGKYIGKPARVSRKNGGRMEGKITAIRAGKLVVEQRRYGGTFSFPVKLKEIERLEVYF